MINKKALATFLKKEFPGAGSVDIKKLGHGVQGAGFLAEIKIKKDIRHYGIKRLFPEGLGHDYPSDRAGVFLMDLDEFKTLPKHIKAVDVLAEMKDGSIKAIGGGREYYLLMEKAEGRHYFNDLVSFAKQDRLNPIDIEKIKSMTSYLADIHSVKKISKPLYLRKIRDTIGHGECLMGVFDTYPDKVLSFKEMADIEKMCIDWRARLKSKTHRLCQIHGDFHPGNIWFKTVHSSQFTVDSQRSTVNSQPDFILLDRSRGPWGDAADDITALTINYIFFSLNHFGKLKGAFLEAIRLFYEDYVKKTGDNKIYKVAAPFYAFRGAVVANPVFYPKVSKANRRKLFNFMHGVLNDKSFSIDKVNKYL
ncbi:MAG: aminoglycoside phosphotransferase family protein [Nitrospirae bacterium]|nr:aminoglycoside phosphotransferase family protein [Nitrospirota bacterium]